MKADEAEATVVRAALYEYIEKYKMFLPPEMLAAARRVMRNLPRPQAKPDLVRTKGT